MQKVRFLKSEVIAYLEELLLDQAATDEQEELYVEYTYTGKLVKNYVYKKTVLQMKSIYEGKF